MAKHIHIWLHRTRDEDFKESDHPREGDGKFTAGGGAAKKAKAVVTQAAESSKQKPAPKALTKPSWTKHGGGEFTPDEMARLKALKVRPDLTQIKLSPDKDAALQVVGRDTKGRAQYVYSAAHSEKASAEKFARLKAFNGVASNIAIKAQQDMLNDALPQKTRDAAAVIRLISETGFRIGSEADTGADVQAHGASTLTGDHVSVKGNEIKFEFIGKKGVKITKTLDHPELARYIKGAKARAGKGKLFTATDQQTRDYLHANGGADFKVKDFRTWNGTNVALKTIGELTPPKTAKEYAAFRQAVGTKVAAHLGNTPSVALASYIDPTVFAEWSHLK